MSAEHQIEGMKTMSRNYISLRINGEHYKLGIGDHHSEVPASHTLSRTLRDILGFTGTKVGCDRGACGACTVLMNGKPVPSCMILTVECDGKEIVTIEGLRDSRTGELDPLQKEFIEESAFQCGFCTPGILMTSRAMLNENPSPTKREVQDALAGHYCRCISHYHVVEAVLKASGKGR